MEKEGTMNKTVSVTDFNLCHTIDKLSYRFNMTPPAVFVILYGYLIPMSVVTVCGNLLVIISVFYFKQLHTPTNFLILSLAVADLLVGIIIFPYSLVIVFRLCVYNANIFVYILNVFGIFFSTCSILHLCCVSMDRYYAVCQPLTYKSKITGHVSVIMISVNWGISAVVAYVLAAPISKETCQEKCFLLFLMATIVVIILSFYLPLVILLCIYLNIYLVAQKQARSIQTSMKGGATVSKMERKATKTLAIVVGVFFVSWTPYYISNTYTMIPNNSLPFPVTQIVTWLALTNSTLNPFIYAFFYSWFRSAFKVIISGKIIYGNFSNTKLQ